MHFFFFNIFNFPCDRFYRQTNYANVIALTSLSKTHNVEGENNSHFCCGYFSAFIDSNSKIERVNQEATCKRLSIGYSVTRI